MVISTYKAQISDLHIDKNVPKRVLVPTANAVQGQERKYVVLVFSTAKCIVSSFILDIYRLYVAMSHHKKDFVVIGNINTLNHQNLNPTYVGKLN